MNIFYDDEGIIGKPQQAHLHNTLQDIRRLARAVKNQLGRQGYLLDQYLFELLNALNHIPASDAACSASKYLGELARLCSRLSKGEDTDDNHPLYEKVKEYIANHPLPYQEYETKMDLYYIALMDDFLGYAIPAFAEKQREGIRKELDMVYLHDLYRKINSILGDENQMEELNLLVRQRFQMASAMDCFIQGVTNSLLDALTGRDVETGKMVLQLWMEQE